MTRSRTYIATPPGATIKEQLNDRNMSQKEFATRMNLSEKHVSKLINGEVQLTPEVAFKLEMVLGVPSSFWNNLEAIYRNKLFKVVAENAMDSDEAIAKNFPYGEMSKLGWVPQTKKPKEKVIYLRKYFEVTGLHLLENKQITRIACRRPAVTEKSDLALMAWAQAAKIQAQNIDTAAINIKALREIIPKIKGMISRGRNPSISELQAGLADCGIALIFLPHLQGTFLQGATFIDGKRIVVGLTEIGKGTDKFRFNLFHELAHIVLGHIYQSERVSSEDEAAADAWAREHCL